MGKGKLVFKGDTKSKKKKKKKSKHSIYNDDTQGKDLSIIPSSSTTTAKTMGQTMMQNQNQKQSQQQQQQPTGPVIEKGNGKITSSGTVLMGVNTNFNSCLNVGDAILVKVPIPSSSSASTSQGSSSSSSSSSTREEMRIVSIRLSDTSASISSAFSQDLKFPQSFQYIKKPKNVQKEKYEKEKKEKMSREEIERCAFGTYNSSGGGSGGQELVYRERTEQGNYRIRRQVLDKDNVDRTDLLDMRSLKKSDRYC